MKKAFTLIELIVVITILAILWTIAFIYWQSYVKDTRDAVRTTDLWSMIKSLDIFKIKKWYLPEPTDFKIVTYSW